MINLLFCILGLISGLWASIYDIKQMRKRLHSPWYIFMLRFIGWFCFGFFGCETIKWMIGINTVIF